MENLWRACRGQSGRAEEGGEGRRREEASQEAETRGREAGLGAMVTMRTLPPGPWRVTGESSCHCYMIALGVV